jgi:hypothetical protein
MAKVTFSRSDVVAINSRMSERSTVRTQANYSAAPLNLSRAPSSPVAAKVMREVGVSKKKISEAYGFAKAAMVKPK